MLQRVRDYIPQIRIPKLQIFIFAVILVYAITIVSLIVWGIELKDIIAVALSLLALLISLFSAFKNELFDFKLAVIADDIWLVHLPEEERNPSYAIIVPLAFLNVGYGEGIIERVFIKITTKSGYEMVYIPQYEIDYMRFHSSQSPLNLEEIGTAFQLFALHSKESRQKHVLFTILDQRTLAWGKELNFEVFVKTNRNDKLQKYYEFSHTYGSIDFGKYLNEGENVLAQRNYFDELKALR